MKVLVIGSGGREHTLAWKIHQSKMVKELFCAPGNGGMSQIATCVPLQMDDIEGLKAFSLKNKINLTVVGPELPLVNGIVDEFEKVGLCIFGPNKEASQLEGSKVFAKTIMSKYGIPTAPYKVFEDSNTAKNYVIESEPPFVIKADGLAAGKGVIVTKTTEEAVQAITNILDNKVFGSAGNKIIIEDFVEGEELSVLAFTDGQSILPLASSQDHKRAFDNDEGPNTGGMGAYSPCPLVSQDDVHVIVEKAIKPAVAGLKQEGITYKGLIYAGIMISKQGPIVLEFNVRFGDPETQAVIPRLKGDLVPILLEVAKGKLETKKLAWDHRSCVSVVLASGGYPGSYQKGLTINGLEKVPVSNDCMVFHAGTVRDDKGMFTTNGGRVLSVSALGETLKESQKNVYGLMQNITFTDAFYRGDIGTKALQHSTTY
ncbi:MAG: phosphoribosylamine--glycine ligase [Candidatus Omnitrophica bacterium]|nr:phosphoribosylamine--glycine ligase [Candidatus Omnitrophota bacterium]